MALLLIAEAYPGPDVSVCAMGLASGLIRGIVRVRDRVAMILSMFHEIYSFEHKLPEDH